MIRFLPRLSSESYINLQRRNNHHLTRNLIDGGGLVTISHRGMHHLKKSSIVIQLQKTEAIFRSLIQSSKNKPPDDESMTEEGTNIINEDKIKFTIARFKTHIMRVQRGALSYSERIIKEHSYNLDFWRNAHLHNHINIHVLLYKHQLSLAPVCELLPIL